MNIERSEFAERIRGGLRKEDERASERERKRTTGKKREKQQRTRQERAARQEARLAAFRGINYEGHQSGVINYDIYPIITGFQLRAN